MATDPRILGDLARTEMTDDDEDSSLDAERDLAITPDADDTDADGGDADRDTARDLAVPPSKLPPEER